MTLTAYDAAYPPPDPHLDVCAFYIGGNTPHVWTDAEIAGQSARYRLPIFTANNQPRDAGADANAIITWLRAHGVPAGAHVALDMETTVASGYCSIVASTLQSAGGWGILVYGSLGSVTGNPGPYWTADWTRFPHITPGAYATQYASDVQLGKPYDLSEVADASLLWDTRPPAPPTYQEDDMQQIEPLSDHPGAYAYALPIAYTGVRFVVDTFGGPPVTLRLVFWTGTGNHPYVQDVSVPGGVTDIPFIDSVHTAGITIQRTDNYACPIAVSGYYS